MQAVVRPEVLKIPQPKALAQAVGARVEHGMEVAALQRQACFYANGQPRRWKI